MKTQINNILRGGGLLAALFLMGTSSVYAATTAGTDITNTATVTFRTAVGGTVDQAGTPDTETFETDRLVNLTVTGGADVSVAPGQETPSINLVRTFTVTNSTNGPIDIDLSILDQSGDNFDADILDILYTAGNGDVYDGGETNGDTISNVAAGAIYTVHVIHSNDISTSVTNGQTDGIYLKAQAAVVGGADITGDTVSDDATTVDNVVADGDGNGGDAGDVARDGAHSALRRYIVVTATIQVFKSSEVIYDPVNCSGAVGAQDDAATVDALCTDGNPKRIPGAYVIYKIAVVNVAASSEDDATQVDITDTLSSVTDVYSGSLWRIDSTEAGYAAQLCYDVGGTALDDADDFVDEGGFTDGAPDVVRFRETTTLAQGDAVVYCYKATID
jgi:hypothetical protein